MVVSGRTAAGHFLVPLPLVPLCCSCCFWALSTLAFAQAFMSLPVLPGSYFFVIEQSPDFGF